MNQFIHPAPYRPEWIRTAAGLSHNNHNPVLVQQSDTKPTTLCCQSGVTLSPTPHRPQTERREKEIEENGQPGPRILTTLSR